MLNDLVPAVSSPSRPAGGARSAAPSETNHPSVGSSSTDAALGPIGSDTAGHGPRAGGREARGPGRSPGDELLLADPAVRRHLRVASIVAAPLAVLVAVQGFALAALVVAVAQQAQFSVLAGAVLVGCAAIRGAADWALERRGRLAAAAAIGRLREGLIRDAAALAVASPGALRPGEIAADAVQQLPAIEHYVGRFLSARPTAAATTVVLLIAIAFADPLSAALLAPTVPLLIVFLWLVGSEAKAASDARLTSLHLLGAHLLDVLRGLPELRAFGREAHQAGQVGAAAAAYRSQTMQTLRSAFVSGLVLELVAMLGTALVAVFGGVRLAGGSAGLSAILPALVLAPQLYAPLRRLGAGYHDAADARAALDRLAAVAAAAAASPLPGVVHGPAAPRPGGAVITLDRVRVDGDAGRPRRLDDLSLVFMPGMTTALLGPSGAGKSTVAHLVLGLLAPTSGVVRAGAAELGSSNLDRWRRHAAWVSQDPVLLPDTLRENARLGAPDATDDDILDALIDAGLGPLTAALPGGLDELLGEDGVRLSSGELRRLALVRAIVADADLIVLDEPTAQLDALTAARLRDTLLGLCRDRTVLLITHDPELAESADEIVELAGGRVVGVRAGAGAGGHQNGGCSGCATCERTDCARSGVSVAAAAATVLAEPAAVAQTGGASAAGLLAALRAVHRGSSRRVRIQLIKAVACGALSAIAAVAVLGLSGGLIVRAAARPPVLELTMLIVLVRLFSIVRATARYGERLASHDAALRMLESVRVRVFTLAATGRTDQPSRVLDQAVGDVDRSADLFVRVLVPAASAVAAVAVATAVAAAFDGPVALTLGAISTAAALAIAGLARRAGSALAAAETGRAALGREVVTALDAGPEFLLAGRTTDQRRLVGDHAAPLAAAAARHGANTAAIGGVNAVAAAATATAVAALAAHHVAGGTLSGAIAAALILAALACIERLDGIAEAGLAMPGALSAIGRLAPALRAETPPAPAPSLPARGSDTNHSLAGHLVAERLVVTRGTRPIIDDASLTVAPGERVALVGESGAGKSTLLLVLADLLVPDQGAVHVGGRPVRVMDGPERAQSVLLVPSRPHLFGGSLAANLRVARPTATDGELTAALTEVGLGSWVAALDDGLGTLLGEDGVRISGGERQRLGLARACLAPATLVLLDEPASHLPEAAALEALTAVLGAVPGRGAVVVSHRAVERTLCSRALTLEGRRLH